MSESNIPAISTPEGKSQPAPKQSQDWFARLLTETLKRYAKIASTDYLVKKYPGLPKDIIAERYITQQARAAALAGAASASVVSAAAVGSATLASSIVAVPGLVITIPVGIAAFAVEIGHTVRLQIRTAYDLCNLYGLSVNPDDPEDIQEIFAMGMGIKAGELTGNVLQRLAPSVAMQQTRRLMRTGIRRAFQDWASKNLSRAIARRYLTEKFLLNAVVPGISIILAAGVYYRGFDHRCVIVARRSCLFNFPMVFSHAVHSEITKRGMCIARERHNPYVPATALRFASRRA